ncbi:hypothetical protein RQM47_16120 [Rubrivirga sp. S365]|uniref:hypothetical protein n=1 Tax=Rubrivirga sp. S365 TaxID=3076080 RepID=UPI0028CACBDB|nr:hypothetical protein [Rubrivirga sp. S365]MDT7858175.1 hypothetical protein [Rubrivirga sp. S365]
MTHIKPPLRPTPRGPALGRTALLAVALVGLFGAPAVAQDAGAPCPYEDCALRIEPTALGVRVVRGSEGVAVGRLVPFREDLSALTASSATALPYARAAERASSRSVLAAVAAGLLLWAAADEDGPLGGGDGLRVGAALGGATAGFYGVVLGLRAEQASARAVWEYNRGLDR